MTRLELLEHVNELNMRSTAARYWTCTVLYNTVIWEKCGEQEATMHWVFEGIPK